MGQRELWFFDPNEDAPSSECRKNYLDPNNPESPYFGFIGNKRAIDKLIRIDFQMLGRYNHQCNDLSIAFIGEAGCGKAQPLDSLVYTPSGAKQMGEIKMNDLVCTPDGATAKIIGVFPQGEKEVVRVHFTDGTFAECCKEHLWLVNNVNNNKENKIVDTGHIIENHKTFGGRNKLSVPVTQPVSFDERKISIDPYVFGILLGDGNFTNYNVLRFSTSDQEIIDNIKSSLADGHEIKKSDSKKYDYSIKKIQRDNKPTDYVLYLKQYGLWGFGSSDKFIPEDYLYNSIDNRLNLLRGLMDSDGYVNKNNNAVYFYSTSQKLADGVKFLVESIGGICRIYQKETSYSYNGEKKKGKSCYVCSIHMNNPSEIFKLSRKKKLAKNRTKYFAKRIIDRVENIGVKQTQCILLDNKEHLYLTNNFIVTHNTDLARRHAKANGLPIVEISPKAIKKVQDIFDLIQKACAKSGIPLREVGELGHYWIPPMNIFIDEVHALPQPIIQGLLKATEHDDAVLVTEHNIICDCSRVHWIIATTDRGKLFDAFDTRFSKIVVNLYTKEEIAQIVQRTHNLDIQTCRLVAHYCGRMPRKALEFTREMCMEYDMDTSRSWEEVAEKVAEDNEIDKYGMTYKCLSILKALGQGPIAEKRLPIVAGVKGEELSKFIMPWLMSSTDDQPAMVTVGHRGYSITMAGIEQLNLRNISHKGDDAFAA